jgi:hypothetical protein
MFLNFAHVAWCDILAELFCQACPGGVAVTLQHPSTIKVCVLQYNALPDQGVLLHMQYLALLLNILFLPRGCFVDAFVFRRRCHMLRCCGCQPA